MIRIPLPGGRALKGAIVACGADTKGAYAVASERTLSLEGPFGDLIDPDNLKRYERALDAAFARLPPGSASIACDLHPGYHSTAYAAARASRIGRGVIRIQHHESHVASVIAEHRLTGSVIGVAFDGTGYGTDGTVWGGEFFAGPAFRLERRAHLALCPMPGAERAITEPWRMAASYLFATFADRFLDLKIDFVKRLGRRKAEWPFIRGMIARSVNTPLTSSAGRLFDAAASIIIGCDLADEEAAGPRELERISGGRRERSYRFTVRKGGGCRVIDWRATIEGIVSDIGSGESARVIGSRFHTTVASMIVRTALAIGKEERLGRVVLGGGVFMNSILRERAKEMLENEGFEVFLPETLAPGDASIPVGQALIAAGRLGKR